MSFRTAVLLALYDLNKVLHTNYKSMLNLFHKSYSNSISRSTITEVNQK